MFIWACSSRVMSPSPSWQEHGRNMAADNRHGPAAESSHPDPQTEAESTLGMAWVFRNLKDPRDTPTLTKPHLVILPKLYPGWPWTSYGLLSSLLSAGIHSDHIHSFFFINCIVCVSTCACHSTLEVRKQLLGFGFHLPCGLWALNSCSQASVLNLLSCLKNPVWIYFFFKAESRCIALTSNLPCRPGWPL